MRALPGFGRPWRLIVGIGVVSAASMAGVPLALGFVAKEADFEVFAHDPFGGSWVVLAGLTVGSMITAAYSIRFLWGAFTAGATDWANAPPPVDVSHRPAPSLVAPAAVLAVVTILLGVAPSLAGDLSAPPPSPSFPAATPVPARGLARRQPATGAVRSGARRRLAALPGATARCTRPGGGPASPERRGRLPVGPPGLERRGRSRDRRGAERLLAVLQRSDPAHRHARPRRRPPDLGGVGRLARDGRRSRPSCPSPR